MALWGKEDDKTSTGTIAITTGGAVTGTSTKFDTEARLGDYIVADGDDEHYIITAITSNTAATVAPGVPGATMTAVSSGTNYTLNEKPKFVSFSEAATPTHGDPELVFGVDTDESQEARDDLKGSVPAGWVRRTVGTGGRAGRTFHETLVAMSTINSDAADDTEFPDS